MVAGLIAFSFHLCCFPFSSVLMRLRFSFLEISVRIRFEVAQTRGNVSCSTSARGVCSTDLLGKGEKKMFNLEPLTVLQTVCLSVWGKVKDSM